jgi:histidine triad (HIT) family protein
VSPSPCTFCEIAAGRLDAHIVLDDDDALGFLDRRPVFKGHVLVVPRAHRDTLLDLEPSELGLFFSAVQRIAGAIESGLGAAGTFVAVNNRISQSVPHLHCHVVPRNPKDGLRGFFWPRTKYTDDAEMATYAATISGALS